MQQAIISLFGIPDSISVDPSSGLLTAHFGSLKIKTSTPGPAPVQLPVMKIEAILQDSDWIATNSDFFVNSTAVLRKEEAANRGGSSSGQSQVDHSSAAPAAKIASTPVQPPPAASLTQERAVSAFVPRVVDATPKGGVFAGLSRPRVAPASIPAQQPVAASVPPGARAAASSGPARPRFDLADEDIPF